MWDAYGGCDSADMARVRFEFCEYLPILSENGSR